MHKVEDIAIPVLQTKSYKEKMLKFPTGSKGNLTPNNNLNRRKLT